ncbi:CpaF family protein [Thermosediminibacter litoriperuensis]|uniref:Pilus assembly protein CpaF n=1 Tax=Thermosediminibacter litoriperuensis TaxID=291989 RepID=A0A5S5AQ56_9FIRM|nr:CpaF family protein [Thermosediminibacter litoriperuensis]TYP53773.1 pilus assembly protein CpaF [Thermosediminibacter litoriperuensis]
MSLLKRLESRKNFPEKNNHNLELAFKAELHRKIVDELKELPAGEKQDNEMLKKNIERLVEKYLAEEGENRVSKSDRIRITAEMIDEILAYGPITPLINDPEISEIMVNGPNRVYVERNGVIELTGVVFRDDEHVMNIIERIVAPIGRRIDESMPMVDARLPDGSRVNAVIPPISLIGPVITIRKFSREPFTVEDLVNFGTLTPRIATFLEACVKARLNILVSGGTGSGKTTTLNVLSSFIPATERIVTIEDAAELQLQQPHVITLESRPPNIEGRGEITIRDLVRNALRMRPDRIIVGEVRGGEALDMLQAMNTGHDGSLATGHANSPRDMLARLETMVLMAGVDLPVRAIREQIASAIDLIIQQSRLKDGSRRITHIVEVQGMEGDVILLQDLFTFRQTGVGEDGRVKGVFETTGVLPRFMERFEVYGIKLPREIFYPYAGEEVSDVSGNDRGINLYRRISGGDRVK